MQLQKVLRKFGFDAGPVDEQFGAITDAGPTQWAAVTKVTFEPTTEKSEAQLTILFGAASDEDYPGGESDLMKFDGPCGELARCVEKTIVFDSSEMYSFLLLVCVSGS